jgi:hypothetical protein
MVVFSFGWTPTQALYPAEVLSYQNRAKGLAFLNVVTQGSSCINTFGLVKFDDACMHILTVLTQSTCCSRKTRMEDLYHFPGVGLV